MKRCFTTQIFQAKSRIQNDFAILAGDLPHAGHVRRRLERRFAQRLINPNGYPEKNQLLPGRWNLCSAAR
ncbi:MAG: hypothetical protein IPL27_21455 [Lewinellaceae bacterium]|nr:hypothetical protein [Lewinellaceae bacterium]